MAGAILEAGPTDRFGEAELREIPDAVSKPSRYDLRTAARKEPAIATSASATPSSSSASESFAAGLLPGAGTFFCFDCGSQLSLREIDHLPDCPRCGGIRFGRDSIFESMQEHGETTLEFAAPSALTPPSWLAEARAELPGPGRYLVGEDDGEVRTFPIDRGWTRIGRSVAADVRLDDPSVSRRHALIVSEPDKSLRVLDDRSLNGVFLNGELIEWGTLEDGDELTVGRYHLFALEG